MLNRTMIERRKLTYRKCAKRQKLYNAILIDGGYKKNDIHRYAKNGIHFLKTNNPARAFLQATALEKSMREEYLIEY